MRMRAQLPRSKLHVRIAAVVVGTCDRERHRLPIDREPVVANRHMIAWKANQALDPDLRGLHGWMEHHDIASFGFPRIDDLRVCNGELQAVGKLLDDDEVPV